MRYCSRLNEEMKGGRDIGRGKEGAGAWGVGEVSVGGFEVWAAV